MDENDDEIDNAIKEYAVLLPTKCRHSQMKPDIRRSAKIQLALIPIDAHEY